MKRRLFLSIGLALPLLAGYLLVLWITPSQRITKATIYQISFGMSESEVEAIFQAPAGDYSGRDLAKSIWKRMNSPASYESRHCQLPDGHRRKMWIGDNVGIVVAFDQHGIVSRPGGIQLHVGLRPPSWLDKVFAWLGVPR